MLTWLRKCHATLEMKRWCANVNPALFSPDAQIARFRKRDLANRFVAQFVDELLAKGETIYSVAPSLTSQYRCRRGTKKNDQVDAANVARALLANPQLPSLRHSDRQRELQELSRAQRRLAEQLRSNRAALGELSQHSPVRAVLEEVIRTLILQL